MPEVALEFLRPMLSGPMAHVDEIFDRPDVLAGLLQAVHSGFTEDDLPPSDRSRRNLNRPSGQLRGRFWSQSFYSFVKSQLPQVHTFDQPVARSNCPWRRSFRRGRG